MTRVLSILLLLLSFTTLFAQQRKTITASGLVFYEEADSVDTPIELAQATIVLRSDSSYVKSVSTNKSGAFSISFEPKAATPYLLRVSHTGMAPQYFTINLLDNQKNKFGKIYLSPSKELDEVEVVEKLKMMEISADTVIFNADAFQLREDAMFEELVQRIPGLEYDKTERKLTYEGKNISELLVNGESFFGQNFESALENMVSKIIKKLKIYDKRPDKEKLTGIKSANENFVVDVQTKPEFSGMIFGNASLAGGNYSKKEASVRANSFVSGKGMNFNFNANTGNVRNTSAYTGARSDDVSLQVSKNFNKQYFFNGNFNYRYNRNGHESASYNEQYLIQGNNYSHSTSNTRNIQSSLSGSASFRYKSKDDKTIANIRTSISSDESRSESNSHNASFSGKTGMLASNPFGTDAYDLVPDSLRINETERESLNRSNSHSYRINGSITRKLGSDKKSPVLDFTAMFNSTPRTSESVSASATTYYRLISWLGGDSILRRNQFNESPTRNNQTQFGVNLSKAFSDVFTLQIGYALSGNKSKNERNTFDMTPFWADGLPSFNIPSNYHEAYVDSLSNHTRSSALNHDLSLSFNIMTERVILNAGMKLSPERRKLNQKTGLMRADTIRNAINYSPNLQIEFLKSAKKDNNGYAQTVVVDDGSGEISQAEIRRAMAMARGERFLSITYNGSTSQPSLSDLMLLTDNSNPLSITMGNPNLHASFTHNISANSRFEKPGINASVSWSTTTNSVTREVRYNTETGGTVSRPVNINGNWNSSAQLHFFKTIKNVQLNTSAGGNFTRSVSLINEGHQPEASRSRTHYSALNSDVSAFYNRKWCMLRGNVRWNFSRSENLLRNQTDYYRRWNFGVDTRFILPANIELNSDFSYGLVSSSNVSAGSQNEAMWNLEASIRFLKNRVAQVAIKWNDILSQRKDYSVSSSASYYSENYSRQIGSYFLVSFSYRFTNNMMRRGANRDNGSRLIERRDNLFNRDRGGMQMRGGGMRRMR